ncbi:hypothetical protein D9M70_552260 [compost metagenome]
MEHVGTVAHSGDHQPQVLQLGIGAADRTSGDAQAIGEDAMGRQLAAGLQAATANLFFHCIGQALVLGSLARLQRISEQ